MLDKTTAGSEDNLQTKNVQKLNYIAFSYTLPESTL